MSAVVVAAASFVLMEGVSYAAHRWVMHGFAIGWHRSHHVSSKGRVERNDLFPLCFAAVGAALFGAALAVPWLRWVAIGVTAYGACYLFVHDIYIHRRLPSPVRSNAYLDWLRSSHRAHHIRGGEPYGMLLPLVRSAAPTVQPRKSDRDALDRRVRVASSR